MSDGGRTRDHQDHNLVLCQLSYAHLKKTFSNYQKQKILSTLFLLFCIIYRIMNLIFKIDLDPLFDYYPLVLEFNERTHHMNALIVFLVKLILGLTFGIILIRLFRPEWGIYHGVVTGVILVALSYGLGYFRKKQQ